jgi:hypothetical protein
MTLLPFDALLVSAILVGLLLCVLAIFGLAKRSTADLYLDDEPEPLAAPEVPNVPAELRLSKATEHRLNRVMRALEAVAARQPPVMPASFRMDEVTQRLLADVVEAANRNPAPTVHADVHVPGNDDLAAALRDLARAVTAPGAGVTIEADIDTNRPINEVLALRGGKRL